MAKKILFNEQAKESLERGVITSADAIGSTMGAAGRTVVISQYYSTQMVQGREGKMFSGGEVPPFVTKDGITVAKSIVLEDNLENIGAQMVRQASDKTAKEAGDGTTQTAVLVKALVTEGLAAIRNGARAHRVKAGIDYAVKRACSVLKEMAVPVDSNDKIKAVATVAANNDKEIGDLIAQAYEKIGNKGTLIVGESGKEETEIEVISGIEVNRGYMSPVFANNKNDMTCVFDRPAVLVTDYTISKMEDIQGILQKLSDSGRLVNGLLIVATDFDGDAYSALQLNTMRNKLPVCLVRAPSSYRRETLEDIAIATGATVISDAAGLKLAAIEIAHLGGAERIVVSEKKTNINGGIGDKAEMADHVRHIRKQTETIQDPLLKDEWEQRAAKLENSLAFIRVGGKTDIEMQERKDRVDDACRAVVSAIEEGVVPGGGSALIRCGLAILWGDVPSDVKTGIRIVISSTRAPLQQMLKNAGLTEDEARDCEATLMNADEQHGYNILTEKVENMFDSGIIDPAKVIRCALQNAASVACSVLTSDVLVVESRPGS